MVRRMMNLLKVSSLGIVLLLAATCLALAAVPDDVTHKAVNQKTKNLETGENNEAVNKAAAWAIGTTHDKLIEHGYHDNLIDQKQIDANAAQLKVKMAELKKSSAAYAKTLDTLSPGKRQQVLKNDPEARAIYIRGGGQDKVWAEKYAQGQKRGLAQTPKNTELTAKQGPELAQKLAATKKLAQEVNELSNKIVTIQQKAQASKAAQQAAKQEKTKFDLQGRLERATANLKALNERLAQKRAAKAEFAEEDVANLHADDANINNTQRDQAARKSASTSADLEAPVRSVLEQ